MFRLSLLLLFVGQLLGKNNNFHKCHRIIFPAIHINHPKLCPHVKWNTDNVSTLIDLTSSTHNSSSIPTIDSTSMILRQTECRSILPHRVYLSVKSLRIVQHLQQVFLSTERFSLVILNSSIVPLDPSFNRPSN